MAAPTVGTMMQRLVDLFGPQASADPTKLYGNLMVSPNGNILMGQTSDDGINKAQITGGLRLNNGVLTFQDGSQQAWAAPGRNKIINGSALISQIASSVTAGSSYTYGGVDRFVCLNQGGQGAFTQSQAQVSISGVLTWGIMQKATTAVASFSAGSLWSGIQQIMEGYNVYDLINQPIAVRFLFYSNVSGTFSFALLDNAATHSYVTSFTASAGVLTPVTISIPAYALTIPQSTAAGLYAIIGAIGGTTYTTSNKNVWQTGNLEMASGATNWAATVNNYIWATDIQVEIGPSCSPYERRHIQQELALVQRYVEQILGQYAVGATNGTTVAYLQASFLPKRITPGTMSAAAASTFYLYSPTAGNVAPSSITWSPAGPSRALATVTMGSAVLTGGQGCILENNSGSYLNVIAEY